LRRLYGRRSPRRTRPRRSVVALTAAMPYDYDEPTMHDCGVIMLILPDRYTRYESRLPRRNRNPLWIALIRREETARSPVRAVSLEGHMNTEGPRAPLHPRPQLARKNWIDLQGDWTFAYDDDDLGLNERWPQREDVFTRTIRVPFPPESPASGIGDTSYHPVAWYRTALRIQPTADKRVILHFGAVDYRASAWVDGGLVATHEGGHAPFSADITATLANGDNHVLVVRAEDDPHDLSQPRGKQDWLEEPHKIWYHRTTGIWQPVWIEVVNAIHIADVRWMADVPRRALNLRMSLNRRSLTPLQLRIQLRFKDELLVDDICDVYGDALEREIVIERRFGGLAGDLLLWSPEQPTLIEATLSLVSAADVVDEVLSYAGLRSVAVKDGRFLLNGRPCYLRMVLAQGYWPESHLAAPNEQALRREVEWIKELGFNGARLHQKAEDPRFLYWCDRLGVLVWGEMASAYEFSPSAQRRYLAEWQEILRRDVSHPCIVAWVPFNESWGVPELAEAVPASGR